MTDPALDEVYFPDPSEIDAHAIAFAQMMFAHTAFEREVAALQDAITNKPGFGEQPRNRWVTRQRPARMVVLIDEYRGSRFPQAARIVKLLNDAIDPCDERNILAHGTWWCFRRSTATILVRSGTRWAGDDNLTEQREYTAEAIKAVTDRL